MRRKRPKWALWTQFDPPTSNGRTVERLDSLLTRESRGYNAPTSTVICEISDKIVTDSLKLVADVLDPMTASTVLIWRDAA